MLGFDLLVGGSFFFLALCFFCDAIIFALRFLLHRVFFCVAFFFALGRFGGGWCEAVDGIKFLARVGGTPSE